MLRVLGRPKWIAALVLALAVASLFAWLGKWQLESAITSARTEEAPASSEAPVPLGELLTAQEGTLDASIGRDATFEGVFDGRDFDVVENRLNGDEVGVWVVGHVLVTDDGTRTFDPGDPASPAPGLAVVLGWAPDAAAGRAVAERIAAEAPALDEARPTALGGRVEHGQAPEIPRGDVPKDTMLTMSPAQLVNRWVEHRTPAYGSYVILDGATPEGLEPVVPGEATDNVGFNMLNVFYAIEWAVFAVFAVFIWWRLARDEYVKELAVAEGEDDALARAVRLEKLRELADRREREGRDAGTADDS